MAPKDKIKIKINSVNWASAFVIKADKFMISAVLKESGHRRVSVLPSEVKWHCPYKDLNSEDRALVDGFKSNQ